MGRPVFRCPPAGAILHSNCNAVGAEVKSATIPPLRVTPEVRQAAEDVLEENESLSAFAESALLRQIELRKLRREFIARGLAAKENAESHAAYVGKTASLAGLDAILDKHRSAK